MKDEKVVLRDRDLLMIHIANGTMYPRPEFLCKGVPDEGKDKFSFVDNLAKELNQEK